MKTPYTVQCCVFLLFHALLIRVWHRLDSDEATSLVKQLINCYDNRVNSMFAGGVIGYNTTLHLTRICSPV